MKAARQAAVVRGEPNDFTLLTFLCMLSKPFLFCCADAGWWTGYSRVKITAEFRNLWKGWDRDEIAGCVFLNKTLVYLCGFSRAEATVAVERPRRPATGTYFGVIVCPGFGKNELRKNPRSFLQLEE